MTKSISGSDLTADFYSCQNGPTLFDGPMKVHFEGDPESPSGMTITIPDLHITDTHEGFDLVLSNFSMNVTVVSSINQDITGMIIRVSGDASGKIDPGAPGSLDISYDNYIGTIRAVAGGQTLAVSGRFKTSACFDDWMTAMTKIPLFLPDGGGCPTAGEILCLYQSNSVKVDISSNQREAVYFDDALTNTFSDCREAEAACF